jgi:hypothetical protein
MKPVCQGRPMGISSIPDRLPLLVCCRHRVSTVTARIQHPVCRGGDCQRVRDHGENGTLSAVATRMIVTSQPDVPCDVCGRRLLRGEQPDVFLASGRRRTVCELCAPRATHEGWLRETDDHAISLPPARPRRGRNLLGRLRGLREPANELSREMELVESLPGGPGEVSSYDFLASTADVADRSGTRGTHNPQDWVPDGRIGQQETAWPVPAVPFSGAELDLAEPAFTGTDAQAQCALEAFNVGEHPRRVAGVARSLGEPSVTVRPLMDSVDRVAIVIAWELSWYRYEVDLNPEAPSASVVAQGTELSELADEDRLANAVAAADGTLSLTGA